MSELPVHSWVYDATNDPLRPFPRCTGNRLNRPINPFCRRPPKNKGTSKTTNSRTLHSDQKRTDGVPESFRTSPNRRPPFPGKFGEGDPECRRERTTPAASDSHCPSSKTGLRDPDTTNCSGCPGEREGDLITPTHTQRWVRVPTSPGVSRVPRSPPHPQESPTSPGAS